MSVLVLNPKGREHAVERKNNAYLYKSNPNDNKQKLINEATNINAVFINKQWIRMSLNEINNGDLLYIVLCQKLMFRNSLVLQIIYHILKSKYIR